MAGKNALASPRVLVLGFVAAAVIGGVLYVNGGNPFHNPLAVPALKTASPTVPHTFPKDPVKAHDVDPVRLPAEQVPQAPVLTDPYGQFDIVIKGSLWNDDKGVLFVFQMRKDQHAFTHTSRDMLAAGYEIYARGSCAADLVFQGQRRTVTCLGSMADSNGERRLGSEPRAGAVGQPSFTANQAPQPAVISQPGTRGAIVNVVADTSRGQRTLLTAQ